MKTLLKRLVETLPVSWQQALRRRHYKRVLDAYNAASWDYLQVVRGVVQPGDTVVDVGANVGYIAATLAEFTGPQGRVIAVEPIPPTFEILTQTASRPGCEPVRPVQAALSATEGEGTMAVPRYADGGGRNYYESSLEPGVADPAEGETWDVPLKTLDALCTDVEGRLSFIKIDVEGHERKVIAGGHATLQKHQPWLLIEVNGDPAEAGSEAAALFDDMTALCYTAHVLCEDGTTTPWTPGVTRVDYLFRPGE